MGDGGRRGVLLLRHGTGFVLYGIVVGLRAHHRIYILFVGFLTIERGVVAVGNLGPDLGKRACLTRDIYCRTRGRRGY